VTALAPGLDGVRFSPLRRCAAGGIRQTEGMEKTKHDTQPTSLPRGSVALEPQGGADGQEKPPAQPLTGRGGALAAVERLYQDHGDELKQLADA
jgi:hypothetical protein